MTTFAAVKFVDMVMISAFFICTSYLFVIMLLVKFVYKKPIEHSLKLVFAILVRLEQCIL